MKYLLVLEYETVTPLVLMFNSIENAEILYTTDKIGKRVTLFVLVEYWFNWCLQRNKNEGQWYEKITIVLKMY